MEDLELRGAGNLLGVEQSGYIYSVPFDRLIPRAAEIMERIFEQSPLAVRTIIEVLHRGMGLEHHYREAKELGEILRKPIQNTEDRKEGTRAFAEKRKPVWKAR
jgi:enoyl-CoA hydratase/carnithine racemase